MNVILMILYCTIVLGILVVIHEGGHYLASRAFGVRVTEFMLGMPGPNIGFKKWGTKFGVTPILLGGYARVCGMEPGEMSLLSGILEQGVPPGDHRAELQEYINTIRLQRVKDGTLTNAGEDPLLTFGRIKNQNAGGQTI